MGKTFKDKQANKVDKKSNKRYNSDTEGLKVHAKSIKVVPKVRLIDEYYIVERY